MAYGVLPQTSTHNPTDTLLRRIRTDSERHQIFPLRRPCFVAVFLRVEIERHLDSAVTPQELQQIRRARSARLVYRPQA